jgi:hypothetical protein
MYIIIARPTAASAAATIITKMAKICPVSNKGTTNREKATMEMLVATSIISMDMRITMALRFARAPYSPMQKRIADSIR